MNGKTQVSYNGITESSVADFLKTYIKYKDLNPIWQEDADEINNFIINIISSIPNEKDREHYRCQSFELLYNNTTAEFEDAVDVKRMSKRKSMCYLAIAMLSDTHRYKSFLNDARLCLKELEDDIYKEETLIDIVEILIVLRDNEILYKDKMSIIQNFSDTFKAKKSKIDDQKFAKHASILFATEKSLDNN